MQILYNDKFYCTAAIECLFNGTINGYVTQMSQYTVRTSFVVCVRQLKGKEDNSESRLPSNAFIRYCN